ncbi:MAG: hypothetical protein GF350_17405 [Chitinivibrionales bacterium]|nr:hypothetical protein [Chitinivibrionales bacterium]
MLENVAKDPKGNKIFVSGPVKDRSFIIEVESGKGRRFAPCDICFTTKLAAELAAKEASHYEVESSEFCKTLIDLVQA